MNNQYNDPRICPFDSSFICPYSVMETVNIDYLVDDSNLGVNEITASQRRQREDVNRIMSIINREFSDVYSELQRYGVQRSVSRQIFRSIVSYVIEHEDEVKGSIDQRTEEIFNDLRKDQAVLFNTFRGFRIPNNRINQIFRNVIRITLQNMKEEQVQVPEPPRSEWSEWEDLGGILTSAPAVSSWQSNRLDVFGKGQDNALWHKYWDGRRWSSWESLGGIITTAPGAVSWGVNRIDAFAVGQNRALWHIYWDGKNWSDWEDLGGILIYAPCVASWQSNRLDVFGVGQNNALWHKYWDGSRWSDWEDLGGILTSAPAAVSWGRNRIDVFGRGQNQSLWHKYWDGSRWSGWEDLGGGTITSGPAAASTGENRIELFARGQRNQLLFREWNGRRWGYWESLDGVITSEPAAVSWGGNRLDVFARGQDNHLWHIWRAR